ncbi:MFS transporter [Anaerospora sp.]|uniref:MFS transporter n=1 Tax=Anaerospora sp. TaxID=1960278 RepID=UPI00289A6CE2|nr:MFS transporter [Anaerospora sp.]
MISLHNSKQKLWTKNYVLLLLGNLLLYQGILMLIPSFPVYMKQIGGNDLQASLPFAVFSISALIVRALSGNAADTLGRRPLLLAGLLILILFNSSYFFVSTIGVILVLRFCQGIGWGMASTTFATIMSDIVPANRRGEGTGYFALSIILATSLATIAGIEIMKHYDFTTLLLVSTSLAVIGMLLTLGISIAPIKQLAKASHKNKSLTWSDLFEKSALLPSVLCFLHSITLGGIMSFLMLYGAEIGVENTWIYFAGHVAMILISRPFAGKLFDQKGHTVVIIPGVILMITGLTLLSYATSESSLLIASLFYGLGYGAAHPSLQAWAINRSPANRKGAANGTFLSSLDLGYAVGAVVLGLIATHTNYAVMYRVSVLFLIAFAGIYGCHVIKNRQEYQDQHNYNKNIA